MINPFIALMVFVGYAEDRLQELKQEKGATAVEYGLIAAVIIATVVVLGKQLNVLFEKITTALTGAGGGGTAPAGS